MSCLEKRLCCPACGKFNFETVFEIPYSDPKLDRFLKHYYKKYDASLLKSDFYKVLSCKDCVLLFQANVPNSEMLEVVYDKWIGLSSAANRPFQPSRTSRDAHELFAISRFFRKPLKDLEVLDYGMGLAKWCQTAQLLGCKVSGFDLAESRMENAKQLGIKVVPWEAMGSQSVDFVNTEQVFEHLVEPFEVINKLASATRPGGVIKISVPHGNAMASRFKNPNWMAPKYTNKSLNPLLPLEHINCWSTESVSALANRVGMRLVSRSLLVDFAFLGQRAIPKNIKELLKAIFRPAYKRWYPHKLYCWLQKPVHRNK